VICSRVEAAVIAALLHDVVDDTRVSIEEVHEAFGQRIAGIVGQVAQLSTTTQLLRRRRRTNVSAAPPRVAHSLCAPSVHVLHLP
jgi:(p)ppGpp synthase/HD superfamily hydrolase